MKFSKPRSLKDIATLINAKILGDENAVATGINEIHRVEAGDLAFVDHPKYYTKCLQSDASYIIINAAMDVPPGKALLVTDNPFDAYCKIVRDEQPVIHNTERISPTANIAADVYISPTAYIGNYVTIGAGCTIGAGVSILDYSIIKQRVHIGPNTVIGSDAFYYNAKKQNNIWYTRMPSCGRVVIEDDVEIGACCTIDKGVSSDTIIGEGTKMDNQIHIGHDSVLGKNCLLAAGTAIAGVVDIGDGVTIWGQCGINKTLSIGNNAVILAHSGVGHSLEGNKTYWGAPADDASVKKRELIWIKRIPEMWNRLTAQDR